MTKYAVLGISVINGRSIDTYMYVKAHGVDE
jgi:hypothetical protein